MIKAVVFDFDGVLVDSELAYLECEYKTIKKYYLPDVKKEDLFPTVGMSMKMLYQFFSDFLHIEQNSVEFRQFWKYIEEENDIDYRAIIRDDAISTLTKLKQMNYRIALASSGNKKDIMKALNDIDMSSFFEVICSGDMFLKAKPNPEIYMTTFNKLGLKPEECLVVEDSELGLQAAISSGARVCCFKDERFGLSQEGAEFYIDKLNGIIGILANQIKAVFFDIDGTLTDIKTHIMPESTKLALVKLKEKKIKIFLSTGRARFEIISSNILNLDDFDGVIYMNGQFNTLNGKEISSYPFSKQQLMSLKKFLIENNICCVFFDDEDSYCNFVNDELIEQQRIIGTPVPRVKNIDMLENMTVFQVDPLINIEQEKELLKYISDVKISRWGENIIDMMSVYGGKDNGVKDIAEALKIDLRETISFGDGDNDIPMLMSTGISIAMGNAHDAVKEKATYVTDCFDADGVYNALKYFEII